MYREAAQRRDERHVLLGGRKACRLHHVDERRKVKREGVVGWRVEPRWELKNLLRVAIPENGRH